MKSKKEEKVEKRRKNPKRNQSHCQCMQQLQVTKLSRILLIQRPGLQIQLSTECPEETMDVLIEKAFTIINNTKDEE
jgi:hypothetical protein